MKSHGDKQEKQCVMSLFLRTWNEYR